MARTPWTRRAVVVALAFLVLGPAAPTLRAERDPWIWVDRYHFDIDPKTPLKDLLPVPPKTVPIRNLIVADLTHVPEVQFQDPDALKFSGKSKQEREAASRKAMIEIARQLAKINFLNGQKTDRFMERLLASRPDLAGLPFTLGDACRLTSAERKAFQAELRQVRHLLPVEAAQPVTKSSKPDPADEKTWLRQRAQGFWTEYGDQLKTEKGKESAAAVAVLMQVLGPEPYFHPGLAQCLAVIEKNSPDKGRSVEALARLAIYGQNTETRLAAVEALKKCAPASATPLLLRGLRYPWPAVARNAADAIVRLKRTDLLPELVKLLDEPDPRAPTPQMVNGQQVPVVRELVRINHHRNCLLCHPPANTPELFGKVRATETPPKVEDKSVRAESVGLDKLHITADIGAVPIPGTPLPLDSYSQFRTPDILVRADVTYLRQDFSLLQKVANAKPWPEMQRFDFLVRTRVLTRQQAAVYLAEFEGQEADSPYRQAALDALRHLTGQDAGTTAQQWRTALKLP